MNYLKQNNHHEIKYKLARVCINNIKDIFNGRYFHFANNKVKNEISCWHVLSEFDSKIKWRDGLEDINYSRLNNMQLCCASIDGLILRPKEIFSFYRVIGEPTAKKGYKPGPVIIKKHLEISSGGGLCQVSSVLFNAALLANLDILEKHNHSVDLWGEDRYIPLGRDAIYVYAIKDLKFRNNLPCDIVIKINADEDCVRCKVFAPERPVYSVTVESQKLNAGGFSSCKVRTIRYIEKNDGQKTITYKADETYKMADK